MHHRCWVSTQEPALFCINHEGIAIATLECHALFASTILPLGTWVVHCDRPVCRTEHMRCQTHPLNTFLHVCLPFPSTHINSFDVLRPGGLQLGQLMLNSGRNYAIFERNSVAGSFYTEYPRHRTLISLNKRFTGRKSPEFNLR